MLVAASLNHTNKKTFKTIAITLLFLIVLALLISLLLYEVDIQEKKSFENGDRLGEYLTFSFHLFASLPVFISLALLYRHILCYTYGGIKIKGKSAIIELIVTALETLTVVLGVLLISPSLFSVSSALSRVVFLLVYFLFPVCIVLELSSLIHWLIGRKNNRKTVNKT